MQKLIVFIFLFIVVNSFSQSPFGVAQEGFKKNLFFIELSGGAMLPSMKYSKNEYSNFNRDWYLNQTEGLAFRIQCKEKCSFSTQLSYRSQGVYFPDQNDYRLQAKYLNLYVPFEFALKLPQKRKRSRKSGSDILFFAGPYIASNIGGTITSTEVQVGLTSNEITKLDYGFEAGLGFRIPTYSFTGKSNLTLKVSYFYGFANTFPTSIYNFDASHMNKYLLSEVGGRFNNGLRLTITYEISLEKKATTHFTAGGDGKKTYKRFLVK